MQTPTLIASVPVSKVSVEPPILAARAERNGIWNAELGSRDATRTRVALTAGRWLKGPDRLLRLIRDLPTYVTLIRALASPGLRIVVRRDWRVMLKSFMVYVGRTLSRHDRVTIEAHHYGYMRRNLDRDFLARICDAPLVLWQNSVEGTVYRIVLSFPLSIYMEHKEGELALMFQVNSACLFTLTFTIAPGRVFNLAAGHVICVGRLQGKPDSIDRIRSATKSCHDVSPLSLMLATVQAICLALNIKDVVGVSAEEQVSIGWETPEKSDSVYDGFWASMGATRIGGGMFHLPVPLPEKSLELIKRNHRSRVVHRRQFKHSVTAQAYTTFRAHCPAATTPTDILQA